MAVVKANAYGHGAVEVACASLEAGASWLGVARIDEGIELRRAGISAPILVLSGSPPECAPEILAWDLRQTVSGVKEAQAFSRAASSKGGSIRLHLKVDTGMGRLGLLLAGPGADEPPEQALVEVSKIASLPNLVLEGVFTHFACADSQDKTSAAAQCRVFDRFLHQVRQRGLAKFEVCHAANSASIIDLPGTCYDLVRAGIMLYGLHPAGEPASPGVQLRPAMTLKTRIIHLKQVPAGFKISYGSTYSTPAPTKIATIALGYADGYGRALSSKASMLLRGQRVPVVGRICMDQTMLDVGSVSGVNCGDEVVVLGRQGQEEISAQEIAGLLGTINYEVVSRLMARVPRTFVRS
jgi:alanine racemase